MFNALRRRRRILRLLAAIIVVALLAPQVWAWHQLRTARAELANFHPEAARPALETCLNIWPQHTTARLLASRAAREDNDFVAADRQLRVVQRQLGGTSDDIAFEWALLQATVGNVRDVEDYLQRRASLNPADGPLVWEALTEGYLRVFRILDAMSMVNYWLSQDADNIRAIELRGLTFVTGKGVVRGSDDFRKVVEKDPSRDRTRWFLIRSLLDLGSYTEAVSHLEWFARKQPDDPEIVFRLARCYNMTGRGAEARRLVDDALQRYPNHGMLLRTRGQFALTEDPPAPAEAERWLGRAVEIMPADYQSHWLLAEAQRQLGKDAEAAARRQLAEQVKSQTERLSELRSRGLADNPLEPELRYEMGVLLLQIGQTAAGERWLQGALVLDPTFKPAHLALADFYEKQGDKPRADEHRKLGKQ